MSEPNYKSHNNIASSRNFNVNFNYAWNNKENYWSPMGISQADILLNNAKSSIHKFGSCSISNQVSQSSPITIWDGGDLYNFPSNQGESLVINSDDPSDDQAIVVMGLDENFLEKTETVILDGATEVPLSGKWSRVFRAYNDGSSDLTGEIYIGQGGGGDSFAEIHDGNNQTLMGVYTVPDNYTGYLLKFHCSAQNSSSAQINFVTQIRTRDYGKVFRTRRIISFSTINSDEESLLFPIELPPKSDIMFNIVDSDGNNGSVNVDFDIALH